MTIPSPNEFNAKVTEEISKYLDQFTDRFGIPDLLVTPRRYKFQSRDLLISKGLFFPFITLPGDAWEDHKIYMENASGRMIVFIKE